MLKEEKIEKVKLIPIVFKSDKGYIINLEELTCTCPYYQRPWDGTRKVICKHIIAAERIRNYFQNPEALMYKCPNCQRLFPFKDLILKPKEESGGE